MYPPTLPDGIPAPTFVDAKTVSATPKPKTKLWERKIGALWIEDDRNGDKYLAGTLDGVGGQRDRILVLKNKTKRQPTHPDWEIFLADEPNTKADIL